MKYIRTKDELIDVSDMQEYEADDENGNRIFDGYGYDNSPIYYPVENIIKQADTIEELCDGFRYVSKVSSYKRIYLSIEQLLKIEGIDFELCDIFGCIETDKGLIYVAKMRGILPNGEIDWE